MCLKVKWLVVTRNTPVERPVFHLLVMEEIGKLWTPGDCEADVEQEQEKRNIEGHVGGGDGGGDGGGGCGVLLVAQVMVN